jgi:hypothetical protein
MIGRIRVYNEAGKGLGSLVFRIIGDTGQGRYDKQARGHMVSESPGI